MNAKKRLGQHFLIDTDILEIIAEAIHPGPGDTVIEIGPGHGELTEKIARRKTRILGIEKDPELALQLKAKFQHNKNIEIIEGDALKLLPKITSDYALTAQGYTLAGNIPYYITGHLFRIISELPNKPHSLVFTVQKEVAERIASEPPRMNLLAASIQAWARPAILGFIPKTAFSPRPSVDSAILELVPLLPHERFNTPPYYSFIKILFKQPRKTVTNNLRELPQWHGTLKKLLEGRAIPENARPQDLDVQIIKELSRNVV